MNNDSTLTLDQRLAQHEEDFVKHHQRALEDHAHERWRMLEDDFKEHPEEWERVGVWRGIGGRDEIEAAYEVGYHHLTVEVENIDTEELATALYRRKAAQS